MPLRNIHQRGNGIYAATVAFRNQTHKTSTFFPDACSYQEILSSIAYAFLHQGRKHPVWGVLGKSAPAANTDGYCRAADGTAFEVRLGLVHEGTRVNTAFPD